MVVEDWKYNPFNSFDVIINVEIWFWVLNY